MGFKKESLTEFWKFPYHRNTPLVSALVANTLYFAKYPDFPQSDDGGSLLWYAT